MKKKLLAGLCCLCIELICSQAEMSFDTLEYDFGKITENSGNLHKDIFFTNTGKDPLVIHRATTGDGGSMAVWPREPIPPGARGKITFVYDTKRIGPFQKTIWIQSNALNPQTTIRTKGEVIFRRTLVKACTESIPLGKIVFDSIRTFEFTVQNTGEHPLHLRFDSYNYPESDLLSLSIKDGDSKDKKGNTFEPGETVRIKGLIKNYYGNSGDFERELNLIYNSYDTLRIILSGSFKGIPPKNKITHGDLQSGLTVFHYNGGKLISRKKYSMNDHLSEERFFKDGACTQIVQYHWPDGVKQRELFFSGGKLVEEKRYPVSY